ncbi:MAG TPA: IclR family transcriptional regulator [Pseudonocardiaceae bacterium]|jgi:DNA-binding IclR family transcriptional regulator|nr:IclR family transcriptional regulator [Pseudonocardiaceae bacterium]
MYDPADQRRSRSGRSSDAGNAAEKTIRLLEAAVTPGGPHLLGDIAGTAGVPKASAHRILRTLVANGFLESDGTGRYPLGPRLRTLAASIAAAQAGASVDDLLAELSRRTGQTVHLALRTGNTATYTHKVDSADAVQMASRVGMRVPLHTTAIGKCVLAGLDEPQLTGFLGDAALTARTPASLTDPNALSTELARVRAAGFAVDDEENEASIRCVAAGVRDQRGAVIGGVSVSTLTFLVPRERVLGWATDVIATADAVSTRLA